MSILRSLAHRNFRLFFIGQGLSLIGTWMQTTAMAWLVNRLTAPPGSNEGSPFWLTMIVFANQIPGLVLGPFSGVVADRFRRRPILCITQSLMMLQAFVLAWLAYVGIIQVWHLLILGLLLGVVSTFDVTTRQAFLTHMVGGQENLANAIALNSSLFNGARLVGPALAGAMLGFGVSEGTCFLLNG
ncbi:MAG TPA: MFS transporter, partial [Gemmataceae bacterium]|nr:MFS transporter [Gemmataceae bacterium]